MIGKLENCIRGYDGIYHLTIATKDNAGAVYDEFHDKDVEITISKPTAKRSLDANAYMWQLCGQIANKLTDEKGAIYTKEDVYRENIQAVGVYRDIPMLNEGAETLQRAWQMNGIGWFTDIVDYLPDKSGYLVRCYYGSSCYNKKQMSRLIDAVVQDAQSLGIDTRTPEEISNLLSLWEQANKQKGK